MRIATQLGSIALGLAALFACSAPDYRIDEDLGAHPLDLAGPTEVVLRMSLRLDDPATMSCRDLHPSFDLVWAGDEGEVTLEVWAGAEPWVEDTVADDGYRLTSIDGRFSRCDFDATVLLDAATPLQGELSVKAVAWRDGYDDSATTGTLTGSVSVVAADE